MCADGWLQYVATVSRPWENPGWSGEVGRVEDVLRKHADMRGHDAARTSRSSFRGPKTTPHILWSLPETTLHAGVVVAEDGTVYVPGSRAGQPSLAAVDIDGLVRWRYPIPS